MSIYSLQVIYAYLANFIRYRGFIPKLE